jgi:Tfp pilus assembly protein PilW
MSARSRRRSARRARRGFSTIEVLVSSTIILIMIGVIYSFFLTQQSALASLGAYANAQGVTRTVMDVMARELRMASFDPTGAALPDSPSPTCGGVKDGLIEATPTSVRFRQDLSGDGVISAVGEDVRYDLVASTIRRTEGNGTPLPLVTGVPAGGFVVRYFDGSNPPQELVPTGTPPMLSAALRACVTKVRIRVFAYLQNPDPDLMPQTSLAETEVAIRNRSIENF